MSSSGSWHWVQCSSPLHNKTRRTICLEQCWCYRSILVNLRLECLCISIRSSSYYLYGTFVSSVYLTWKIFPLLISLRLEVQETEPFDQTLLLLSLFPPQATRPSEQELMHRWRHLRLIPDMKTSLECSPLLGASLTHMIFISYALIHVQNNFAYVYKIKVY